MNLRTLMRDVRVGLSALLAAQGVVVTTLSTLGVPAKTVDAVVSLAAAVYGVVSAVNDLPAPAVAPAPTTPPAPPSAK